MTVPGGDDPAMALRVVSTPTRHGVHLGVSGELDMSTADELLASVVATCSLDGTALLDGTGSLDGTALLDGTGFLDGTAPPALVEVDLSELAFLDAVGVSALLRASTMVRGHGGRLVVRGVRPFARRLFALTGVGESLGLDAEPSAHT